MKRFLFVAVFLLSSSGLWAQNIVEFLDYKGIKQVPRCEIVSSAFETLLHDYIEYERNHCTEYSKDWIIHISNRVTRQGKYRVGISVVESHVHDGCFVNEFLSDKCSLMYMKYMGHRVYVQSAFSDEIFAKTDRTKRIKFKAVIHEYDGKKQSAYILFYDPSMTTVGYDYNPDTKDFTEISRWRGEDIYKK
jgi:hypothetical protein